VNVGDDGDAHRSRGTLSHAGGAVALAACWIAAGALLWQTKTPALHLPELDPRAYFAPSELERIADYRALTRGLWAGSRALELVVLGLLVWKAGPLARLARRLLRGRTSTAVSVGLAAVALVWLATLPLEAVSQWWRRRYGISHQGYGAWLGDQATSLGLRALLVSIAVAGAVSLAARLGGRWWIPGGAALAVLGVLFVLAQPLVVQPLFNRFEPLADHELAARIEALGRPLGVRVETVQVADASRRTTAANAYVAGIGPTRRVVLFDTLLDGSFTRGEILAVSAHELAHVGRRHLWKGVAWFALLAVPGVFLVARITERRGGLRDPALVPLGLLVALAFSLATQPLQNTVSRRYEAEADWLGLTAARDPRSAIGLYRKLTLSSLGDPNPPGWARFWLSTHPSTMARIAMADAFAAREEH
jgi:STE24 endopeptidase